MASNVYALASKTKIKLYTKIFNQESLLKWIGKAINTWNIKNLKGLSWLYSYRGSYITTKCKLFHVHIINSGCSCIDNVAAYYQIFPILLTA